MRSGPPGCPSLPRTGASPDGTWTPNRPDRRGGDARRGLASPPAAATTLRAPTPRAARETCPAKILIDGSSTVAPLTSAAAEAFTADNGGVNITVGTSGTGGGFELFCAGSTQISDASRAIKDEEIAACEKGGVKYEELRVASDGITMVTGANSDVGGDNLTSAQLKAIWEPKSTIKNWDQIPPAGSFNDAAADARGPRLAVGHLRLLQRGDPR